MSETKTRAPRCTAMELERRIDDIYELVVAGQPLRVISKYMQEKCDWRVSYDQLEKYKDTALARARAIKRPEREAAVEAALARLAMLQAVMFRAGDYRGCLMVEHERSWLLGAAEPERVNVTLTDPAVKREAWADIVAREVENAASYAAKRN